MRASAEIARWYAEQMKALAEKADSASDSGRARGGVLRSMKGSIVETLVDKVVNAAAARAGIAEVSVERSRVKLPIRPEYIGEIEDTDVREHIQANLKDYIYTYNIDRVVKVVGTPVVAVECKAFAENAMLKRIVVDARLVRSEWPDVTYLLFQLESQLGGDYSESLLGKFGSKQSHAIVSRLGDGLVLGQNLVIMTLLRGGRLVDAPIHDSAFNKELTTQSVDEAIDWFATALRSYGTSLRT